MIDENTINSYVNLFHEVGMLAQTPRSGFAFLGSGKQSVAEHSYRMTLIAYALAEIVSESRPIDKYKLMMMCLVHDLPEARMGDLNYVNKKYVAANEGKVVQDLAETYPCGPHFKTLIDEYNDAESIEAQLAHDADQLELLCVLKQESEKGNPRAMDWFKNSALRLLTEQAKKIAEEIRLIPSHAWWFANPDDPHWINGGKS